MDRIPVAILGATGTVGQKFIVLLEDHPFFQISELVASPRSAGKRFAEACHWNQNTPIPARLASMVVKSTGEALDSPLLFSGLDAEVAGDLEEEYARRGYTVITNSRNHRMDPDVPIIIPEINADHLEILRFQKTPGSIVTNSNCSTMFLAMTLAPIHRTFGVEAVHVTTMQAISGAGHPGVPSMDILGNVIPYIGGEEEKMETETQKILGTLAGDRIVPAPFVISAQCNRVPVFDGHVETLSIKLRERAEIDDIREVLAGFRGLPQEMGLPSAPAQPLILMEPSNRPQPARDIWLNKGMSTCIGRIRPCPIFDVRMVILGHNTVRGAAGAAILNAETMLGLGYLNKQTETRGTLNEEMAV